MTDKKKRSLLFWILVIFFFTTACILIPYSLGYRFNMERGIFIYTGSISFKSTPQDVSVSVDKKSVTKGRLNLINNSYHIGGLTPGEHFIEVSAPDFKPWSKKVSVNSGLSAEFWNVELVRENYPRIQYQTPQINNFFYDPQKRLVAYTENNDETLRVNILDINNETVENVFNSNEWRFTPDPKENIEWSPSLYKIIIPVVKDENKNYFIVETDTKKAVSLQELAETSDLSKVRWDSNDRNYIYYLSESNLFRLNINDTADKKIIASNITSYDLSGNKVYYFQLPGGIVYSIKPDSSSDPVQITTSAPANMNDPSYQITTYDERRIALLNKSGSLSIFNDGEQERYFRELASNIKGIQFSDDGKKLLYWSDWEINAYFLRIWEVQPFRNENDIKNITRFSEKIDNVQWSKDYEHVLFSAGGKIKIVEIDHRDQKNLADLTDLIISKTKIVNDSPNNKLYFIDTTDGIPLFNSIDFLETTTLF